MTFGGESGIRTHGELPHAGFQDRYLQPLGHLSSGLVHYIKRDSFLYLKNRFNYLATYTTISGSDRASIMCGEVPKWLKGAVC